MTYRSTTAKPTGPTRFKFFGETINELKKVVWLTRREAAYLTALVLIISIAVGLVLGIIDYGFTVFVEKVLLGK